MSEIDAGTALSDDGRQAARRLASGLRLAAAPVFSVMALLAGLHGDGAAADVLCLTADHASPFSGMVVMYLLMSAFHLPPWLLLFSGERSG
jgi:hypothetical protein